SFPDEVVSVSPVSHLDHAAGRVAEEHLSSPISLQSKDPIGFGGQLLLLAPGALAEEALAVAFHDVVDSGRELVRTDVGVELARLETDRGRLLVNHGDMGGHEPPASGLFFVNVRSRKI